MPGEEAKIGNKPYLSIVGGNIVRSVPEGTEKARRREYETSDKKTGVKYELVYSSWSGVITGISFKETDFGTMCRVDFEDAILTVNTAGRYFSDIASKIVGADLSRPIKFHPFDMETDTGKKVGVSVQQDGEKLKNYFYDEETKKPRFGYPVVDDAKKAKKSYWKVYYAEVEDFLIEQMTELGTKLSNVTVPATSEPEVDIDDIDGQVMPWEEESN